MMNTEQFNEVFLKLSEILKSYEIDMDVNADTDDHYSLDARKINPLTNKPTFFGAAQIRKNYVSYYLMPVYIFPELLNDVSTGLTKRMQGKSCFNFKTIDEPLINELETLTKRGFEKYKENVLV